MMYIKLYEEFHDWRKFPSLDFSEKTGIEVYKDWKLPRKIDSLNRELPKHFPTKSENKEWIELLWRDTVLLNPEIESWVNSKSPDSVIQQKWDIIFGMVSKFNEDDIKSYLLQKGFDKSSSFKQRVKDAERRVGAYISWILSDKTLEYIENKMPKK